MLGHGCYRTSGTHPHPAPGLPVSAFFPLATLSPGNSLPLLDAVSGHLPQVSMSRIFNGNRAPVLRHETVLPARVLETGLAGVVVSRLGLRMTSRSHPYRRGH